MAAGARVRVRVGALPAEGCVARLRVGEAVRARDGLEVRDRVLGADRVTCARCLEGAERITTPERDGAVGRGAALERVGALEVMAPVGAREDRSGLTVDAGALRRVVLFDASLGDVEATTRRPVPVGRTASVGRAAAVRRTTAVVGRARGACRMITLGVCPEIRTRPARAPVVGAELPAVRRVEPTRVP